MIDRLIDQPDCDDPECTAAGQARTAGTWEKPHWCSRSAAFSMRSRKLPSGVCAREVLPGCLRLLAEEVTCATAFLGPGFRNQTLRGPEFRNQT